MRFDNKVEITAYRPLTGSNDDSYTIELDKEFPMVWSSFNYGAALQYHGK